MYTYTYIPTCCTAVKQLSIPQTYPLPLHLPRAHLQRDLLLRLWCILQWFKECVAGISGVCCSDVRSMLQSFQERVAVVCCSYFVHIDVTDVWGVCCSDMLQLCCSDLSSVLQWFDECVAVVWGVCCSHMLCCSMLQLRSLEQCVAVACCSSFARTDLTDICRACCSSMLQLQSYEQCVALVCCSFFARTDITDVARHFVFAPHSCSNATAGGRGRSTAASLTETLHTQLATQFTWSNIYSADFLECSLFKAENTAPLVHVLKTELYLQILR